MSEPATKTPDAPATASATPPAAVTPAAPAPAVAVIMPKVAILRDDHMRVAEAGYVRHRICGPATMTLADTRDPHILYPMMRRLTPGDVVEFTNEIYSFFAERMITEIMPDVQGVRSVVIVEHDYATADKQKISLDGAQIVEAGKAKWCIVHNNKVIKDGFLTRALAEAYLSQRRGE
jgi:hypothetical protein